MIEVQKTAHDSKTNDHNEKSAVVVESEINSEKNKYIKSHYKRFPSSPALIHSTSSSHQSRSGSEASSTIRGRSGSEASYHRNRSPGSRSAGSSDHGNNSLPKETDSITSFDTQVGH